jgi:ferritin
MTKKYNRRASTKKYLQKMNDTIAFKIGDIVTYAPSGHVRMGVVMSVEPKIRKIYVDWGPTGKIEQHDSDELQLAMIQDPAVKKHMKTYRIARIARRILDVEATDFLSEDVAKLLNLQYANELSNSVFYRSCASFLNDFAWIGFEKYFIQQANDEAEHAQKVFDFLVDSGCTVDFPEITKRAVPQDPYDIVKMTVTAEVETTTNWRVISKLAKTGCCNPALDELCQWFIKEQMEEEAEVLALLQKTVRAKETGNMETLDCLLRKDNPGSIVI